MDLRKAGLAAAAIGAAVAFGGSSPAQAAAVGYASLNIFNFTLSSGGQVLSVSDFDAINPNNTTSAGATLFGFGSVGDGHPTDVPLQCIGACGGIGQNNFSQQPLFTSGTFARGDALLTGALINGTPAGPAGAQGQGVAEIHLGGDAGGTSNSEIATTAAFSFSIDEGMTIRADFDAIPQLLAAISGDANPGSTASAGISFTISVTDSQGNEVFEWTPNGLAGNISGGTEIEDGCDLTRNASAGFPGQTSTYGGNTCSFAAELTLAAGSYTLQINQEQTANGQSIPEPATMALLASGLLGLGALGRRRRK